MFISKFSGYVAKERFNKEIGLANIHFKKKKSRNKYTLSTQKFSKYVTK